MTGHEDWVQCLSLLTVGSSSSDLLIASGGQDNFVRIWKIGSVDKATAEEELKPVKDLGPEEEIRQKEEIFSFAENYFSVNLESILAGHEDKVYGLRWHAAGSR
jgi:elongator complex protein 2